MGRLRGQQGFGARAQRGRIAIVLLHPGFQYLVHRAAAPGRARLGVDGIQRSQPEHLSRVEGVGIGLEAIDLGDRDLARPNRGRRRRRGPGCRPGWAGAVDRRRPFAQMRRAGQPAGHRLQPQPEARGDRRRARVAPRPGHQHLPRAERAGEIVRREPDPPFERRQAEIGAEAGRQPGIGCGQGGPDAFVEPGEHHQVGMLQPRFDETPDEDPRMLAIRRPHRNRRHQPFDHVGKLPWRHALRPLLRRRLQVRRAAPPPRGPPARTRRRPRPEVTPPRAARQAGRQGLAPASNAASSPRSKGSALFHQEAACARTRASRGSPSASRAEIPASPAAGRGPRRTRSSCLTPSSQSSRSGPAMTRGCLSKASSGTGAKCSAAAAAAASSKVPGGVCEQRPAGAVVRLDAPALQMGRDPPRQGPVRRDQGGRPARGLQHLAQRKGDRLRLLGRIGELEGANAGEPPFGRRQLLPFAREGGRRHGVGDGAASRGRGIAAPPPQRQRSTSLRPTPMRSSSSFRWNWGWVSIGGCGRPCPSPGSCGPSASHSSSGNSRSSARKHAMPCSSLATTPHQPRHRRARRR